MPLVLVARDPKIIEDHVLKTIAKSIPWIVAKYLSVEDNLQACLAASDIEVRFIDFGKFDVHNRSMEITIQANYFQERNVGLVEKAKAIAREIHESTSCGIPSMSVWIQLIHAGYWQTH